MLFVAARSYRGGHGRGIDFRALGARIVRATTVEHVAVDCARAAVRLDVIDGSVVAGPVTLVFQVADAARLDHQVSALRALRDRPRATDAGRALMLQLLALQADDARAAGRSLRQIADLVLGPGDWPGDGDHRKSRVRRLVQIGRRLILAGPRTILWPDRAMPADA